MRKLKRKCDKLEDRAEDVKEKLKYAEGLLLKKRRKVVEKWMVNVASIKNEVQQMGQKVRERSWFSLLKLERKMKRLTEEVTDLDQQGQFPDGLTFGHGNQPTELITTNLIGQTFQQHKNMIWEWLGRDNVSKIGVYGMGGVGKTTLFTHIHNELLAHPDFTVSWMTVSQNFSIRKLQSDIAKQIGLELENGDDERQRAANLAPSLRNMKNFVLILDDVRQDFEPYLEVGIPLGRNECKLILTSRSSDVCDKIGCEAKIKVGELSEEEAWELFTHKLEHRGALSAEIEDTARSLTKKCSGLPLGIITMAGSMKGKEDIIEWHDHHDDMGLKVFKVLKYSYDQLKDPKVQQCFLYCSLFSVDYEIDRETLIEHFIDEGFVDGLRSRQAELDRGHTVLKKLENVCLLEAGKKYDEKEKEKKYVKMHDLVRVMAIQIARENFQFCVEAGEQLKDIPGEEKWAEDLRKVSLMDNLLLQIPSSISPKCPRLTTLMLNDSFDLKSFQIVFSYMPQLSVLDLSRTGIENLPKTISVLENLIALWLEGCQELNVVVL
nr:LOW QUALITY PROTEIN: probable disease resistance protein At4g14610 [Ziziphus jujuba var. spinosa]